MITYAPLWETMKQRHITTYALIKNYAFSRGTLDSLKHNRNITTQHSMISAASSPAAWRMCWPISRTSLQNRNCPFPIEKWAVLSLKINIPL